MAATGKPVEVRDTAIWHFQGGKVNEILTLQDQFNQTPSGALNGKTIGNAGGEAQTKSPTLAARFKPLAQALAANEAKITAELIAAQDGRAGP